MQLIPNCKHVIHVTLSAHRQRKSSPHRLWQQDYNRSQQHEFTWKTESTAKEYTENTKTS